VAAPIVTPATKETFQAVVIGNTNHYSSCVSKNNYFGILILFVVLQIIVLFRVPTCAQYHQVYHSEFGKLAIDVATLVRLFATSFICLRTNSILDLTKIFERIVLHCLIMALNSVT
jgi:NADH:ubiquinone oxidoreductase subunit 3 (subunit A)